MTPDDPRWLPTQAPALYSQDGKGYQATVHAHFFLGENDWLVTEYDPTEGVAFGWACLNGDRQNAELGYVSLDELAQIAVPVRVQLGETTLGLFPQQVEREEDWTPITLEAAVDLLDRRQGRD